MYELMFKSSGMDGQGEGKILSSNLHVSHKKEKERNKSNNHTFLSLLFLVMLCSSFLLLLFSFFWKSKEPVKQSYFSFENRKDYFKKRYYFQLYANVLLSLGKRRNLMDPRSSILQTTDIENCNCSCPHLNIGYPNSLGII